MQNKKPQQNLFELLQGLTDHRRRQGRRHPLQTVLIIVIMAVMSGAKGERAVARFAENNKAALIKVLRIARREVPSRYVISGVMRHTDFEELTSIFSAWALSRIEVADREWLQVDGKAVAGTVTDPHSHRQGFLSLVTVFAGKRRQALAARSLRNEKTSEVPQVRQLIRLLDLEGVVFTLDALHCKKETAAVIRKTGSDYCIGVKGNQPKLLKQVKKTAARPHRYIPA